MESRFFERKEMKRKEVEEVVGAGDSWENVDQMDGKNNLAFATKLMARGTHR
jgi:hypothetical protein